MTITIPTRVLRLAGIIAAVLAMSLLLTACPGSGEKKPAVNAAGQRQTQSVVSRLQRSIPAYEPRDSAERRNLNERLKRWENPNKIGYIALVALDGTLVWYGTIKGKPSSLNSHVTNDQDRECSGTDGTGCTTRPSPDLDGSWGDNPQGVFFFDTAGIYHEWSGTYFLSDAPSKLSQQPKLQVQANAGPTPNGGGSR
jgi:hypothetical protein